MSVTTRLKVCLLTCALMGMLLGDVHLWQFNYYAPRVIDYTFRDDEYNCLTKNNGSHAVAVTEYDNASKAWLSIVSERQDNGGNSKGAWAYEWKDWGFLWPDLGWNGWQYDRADYFPRSFESGNNQNHNRPRNAEVAINSSYKLWGGVFLDPDFGLGDGPFTGAKIQGVTQQGQSNWKSCMESENDHNVDTMCSFVVHDNSGVVVYTVQYDNPPNTSYTLYSMHEIDGSSGSWDDTKGQPCSWTTQDWRFVNPSLAIDAAQKLHLLYDDNYTSAIFYKHSEDWGYEWNLPADFRAFASGDVSEPCITTCACGDDNFVFGCYVRNGEIEYRFSLDGGVNWRPPLDQAPNTVPLPADNSAEYDRPNVTAFCMCNGTLPNVLLVARCKFWTGSAWKWTIRGVGAQYWGGTDLVWFQDGKLPFITTSRSHDGPDQPLNPSVASVMFTHGAARGGNACYVVSEPWGSPVQGRTLNFNSGICGPWVDPSFWEAPFATTAANTARLIALDASGGGHYASVEGPYWEAGEVFDRSPMYFGGGIGKAPALALDGDGKRWVAFVDRDSVFCLCADEYLPRVVYHGDSAAVPGQPSIVCYPGQASGAWVSAITFCVYDTIAGTSRVMFARACTSGVVLDTIENVANLGDSLPCLSVFRSDTLVVTWQHGDSTLASMLCDYGPGTSGRPPAWSSPSLVTANGHHAMSRFDDNGTVLNVVWTRNNGSNYAIQRATCDLATTAFGNWSTMATPGDTGTAEKANPVYAGLGVTCWQAQVSGKWTIKGFVRGDTVTLVANDTDACQPHVVAESSAVSPSIDQIRCRTLYSAGIEILIDSGVVDTGVTRYACDSFNVSHACSDATKANTGAKLVRKNGSDSLFSVYSDLDNAVVFAWSANGDTWQRAVVVSGREYPAIAEDSSGRRWVVVTKPLGVGSSAIEAYYRSGSSWVGPQTLYTNAMVPLGPASLAGASYVQSGIAYAAFLNTSGMTKSVILAKFDGTNVSTYTVATGASLGDPAVTVEPYKADSDHVHVTWTESGVLRYRMDTDGRSSSIANNWTSTYDLTGGGVTAQHPSINSDADQIVVAWAQGSPTDVYARKRSTDSAYNNWEAAVNLSNTSQDGSDWPTIAMGDTVVVAWQELRTGGGDFDIMVSVDFGDTLNIADNATISTYPHILFYNKASGDTAIPYLHTVWSEAAEYYEVGYNKLNLKEAEGEGQQTANLTPIPARPMLEACRPNPFKSHTQISYALPTAGNVSLRVYDITGRTVRTLASGHQKAGSYSVTWDSKDNRGRQVPRGVYFYRLDTPGFRSVKKAVVTR